MLRERHLSLESRKEVGDWLEALFRLTPGAHRVNFIAHKFP
jgi:hypothetical protein